MRFALLALPLALAACSSDPVPVDSGPADVGPVQVDIGNGTDVVDVPAVPHDQGADSGAADAGDAVAVVDAPAVDVVDAGMDAVAVGDAVDVVDAGVADAVALEDVADVQLVDVAADRPDVVAVDVPRDAGPVDGGPVVYDLEAARAGLEVHFAGRRTLPPPTSTSRDCPDDPSSASCSVVAGVVSFNLGACFGTSLTGRFVLGDAGASTLSIFGGGGGSSATVLRFATGSRVGGRRGFHVQFSAAPFQGEVGFSGIPGRTVDPALADLWLLGCASD